MLVLINNGNGFTDYTQYVIQGSLSIEDAINVPTTIQFQLCNINSAFVPPVPGAYLRIVSEKYIGKVLATGFVTNEPEREFLGLSLSAGYRSQFQLYTYDVKATSDEWLLNVKSVPYIPAFVNLGTGQILAKLAEALAPGFFNTTSQVASGDLVPYFAYSSDRNWSDIAKELADGARYRYKVIDRTLYFQPFGDTPLGVSYDEVRQSEAEFYPAALKSGVLTVPPVNDATVLGDVEPQTICEDTFVGDGFTGNFPLRHHVFDGESNILLQDDWTGNTFNTTYWDVEDPFNTFSLIGQLNVVGGDGTLGTTYILAQSGIELGGGVNLQHGQYIFNDTCEGILGGIYDQVEELDLNKCIAGFRVTPSTSVLSTVSGASGIIIQPIYKGQLVGPQIVTQINHQYFLQTVVNAHRWDRFNQIYRTLDVQDQFGGDFPNSKAEILYIITDLDLGQVMLFDNGTRIVTSPGVDTTFVQEVDDGLPPFGVYLPVNCQFMNVSITATLVAFPPQGSLRVSNLVGPTGGQLPILPSQVQEPPQNYLLGFGFANDTATVSLQGDVDNVSFYADDLPAVGARIHFRSWASGTAIGRVRDSNNVLNTAVIDGDDGVRAAIITGLKPLPRTSAECENAAAAAILDRENPQFQGSYSFYNYFWNALGADYPRPGKYFFCNAPNRKIKEQNLFVNTTRATVVELRDEIIQFEIDFGADLYLEKLIASFLERTESILTPQQTSTVLTPLELSRVGFFYGEDLHDARILDFDSLTATFDLGVIPATGCEVRRSDTGWGRTNQNLLGTFSDQFITFPRTQIDQTWYLRQVNGTRISRNSTKLRLVAPLIPSPPLLIGQSTTALVLDFNGDIRNIYGVEIRVTTPITNQISVGITDAQRLNYYVTLNFPAQSTPPFSPGDIIKVSISADPYSFAEGSLFVVDAATNSSVSYWQSDLAITPVSTPDWAVPAGVTATVQLQAVSQSQTIVGFFEANGVVTVQTALPHGFSVGDQFIIEDTPTSQLFGLGFSIRPQTVTNIIDDFNFQFNDVFFVQLGSYSFTNVTGAYLASLTGTLGETVIFQKVAATPGDLNFDLTIPKVAQAIALSQSTTNPQMICYFFNLLWGYSDPLILQLPILVQPRGTTITASGTKACTCLDPRDFGAIGDGVADDTAAVQAALNQARANYLANKPSDSSVVCIHTCEKCLVTPQVLDNCNGVGFGQSAVALFIDTGVTLQIDGELELGPVPGNTTAQQALSGHPLTIIENRNAFVVGKSDSEILIRGKGKLNGNSIPISIQENIQLALLKHTNFTGGVETDFSGDAQSGDSSFIVVDNDDDTVYISSPYGASLPLQGHVRKFNCSNGNYLGDIGTFPNIGQGNPRPSGGMYIFKDPVNGKWLLLSCGSVWGGAFALMSLNPGSLGQVTNALIPLNDGIHAGFNHSATDVDEDGNIWIFGQSYNSITASLDPPTMWQFRITGHLTISEVSATNFAPLLGWTAGFGVKYDPLSKNLIVWGQDSGSNNIIARVDQRNGFNVLASSIVSGVAGASIPLNIGADGKFATQNGANTVQLIQVSDCTLVQSYNLITQYGITDTIRSVWYDFANNYAWVNFQGSQKVYILDLSGSTKALLTDEAAIPDVGVDSAICASYGAFTATADGKYVVTNQWAGAASGGFVAFIDFWQAPRIIQNKSGVIGIRFYNCDKTRVTDLTIEKTTLCGIEWGLSDKAEILDTYCIGPDLDGWGYLLDTLTNFSLSRNLVYGDSSTGLISIGEYGCSDGIIDSNIVEKSDTRLFLHSNVGFESGEPKTCAGLLIEGNTFSGGIGSSSIAAVKLGGQADSIVFRGNTIRNNSQIGMNISGLKGATISGNSIKNNQSGLYSDQAAPLINVSIVDNVIEDNIAFDLAMPTTEGGASPLYDNGTNIVYAFNPAIDSQAYYSTGRQPIVEGSTFGKVGQAFPLSGPANMVYAIKGGANPIQQVGTAVQVSIGNFTLEFPDKEISYTGISTLSPAVSGDTFGLYYVFVDDPWHDGVTDIQYGMTQDPDDLYTSQARLFLGNIWLLSSGGGVGTGGGSGPGNGPILAPAPYLITCTWDGVIPSSTVLVRHPAANGVPFFFNGLGDSAGVADTPAAATATFSVKKNGVQFGTMVFATGATFATFTGTPTSFQYPDVLKVVAPASPDATLADIGFTLKGFRQTATIVQSNLTLSDDNSANWNDAISTSNPPSFSDSLNNWKDEILLLFNNSYLKPLSDSLNFWLDSISIAPHGQIGETMLMSDMIIIRIGFILSDQMVMSDIVTGVGSAQIPQAFSDTFSLTDAFVKVLQLQIILADSMTLSDNMNKTLT